MRMPLLLVVNWEFLCYPGIWKHYLSLEVVAGEILGGWLDKVRAVLWQSRAEQSQASPAPARDQRKTGVQREKWRELLATPHSAQHPASSGQPTLLPTEPNQAIFVVDLSTTIFRIACMTSVGVVITRLRSLWVCPQHHSLQFSGSE